jgi:hypothetical protein
MKIKFHANIRLERMKMIVENTLAYYDTAKITAATCIIAKAPNFRPRWQNLNEKK